MKTKGFNKLVREMETNCLLVKWDILRDVFGVRYWNVSEQIVCVPIDRIDKHEWVRLEEYHGLVGARKAQYLIAEQEEHDEKTIVKG